MRLISPSAARPNFPSAAVGMLILFVAVAAIGCGGHGKAEKLHDQGALLLKNRRLYKAIEKFEEALALKPDQVKTLAFCAEAYLKTGKGGSAELAIKYAGKAVELDPERHQAYLTLGQAHLKLALEKAEVDRRGEVKLDQDELDKAGEIVRRLEKEQAGSIERTLLQGRIDYLSDRLDEAERVYRAALEHSPDNPTGRLGMIEVLVAKEAYDRAEALARQMLEGESPPNPKALDQLAWCMARQGRSNEAYAALEPYLGGENKTPEVSNYLTAGRILIGYLEELSREGGSEAGQANAMKPAAGNESQWDWALSRLADLGSAMKGIYPDLPESYFYRGVSYQLLDDLDRSIEHFRQASEKRPADKRLRMMLAGALMQRREFPSARQELKTLLRIIPADFDARVRLAQCHAAEGSYEQAMEYLKPLHREHSDNAMVLELIARVMLMSDERDEVDTGLRILSELAGPEGLGEAEEDYLLAHSALREALSLIERNLQRQAEEKLLTAERLFENVARARPDEAGVQLKLGQLAQRRGDLFSALSYASRAAGIDPENRPFMARVLVRLGQFEAAGRIYDQILKKNPGATGFELARAEVDGRLGRTQEAVERCERVMKDHPDDPRAPLQKAALLVGQGQVDEAATVLNEALGRLPGNPAIRVALARLRIVQDDAPEAAAILSAALKIMESRIAAEKAQGRSSEDLRRAQRPLAPIYLELAIAELLAGKPEEALEHAREAGEVDPGRHNQSAQMAAIVWLHKDRPGEALAALDRINTDSGPIPEQAPLIEALARAAAGRPAEALAAFANQTYLNEEVAGLMREMLRARSREQMGRVAPKLAMHLLLSEDSAYPRLALRLAEAALAEVDDDPFLLSRWAEMLLRPSPPAPSGGCRGPRRPCVPLNAWNRPRRG